MTVKVEQTGRGCVVHVGGRLAWALARMAKEQLDRLEQMAINILSEEPHDRESERSRRARAWARARRCRRRAGAACRGRCARRARGVARRGRAAPWPC